MSKRQDTMLKIAGFCGIICPLVAFSFIALAISGSLSWFRWTTNALSDLAGTQATATAAALFNYGLIIGALLGIVFAFGLMQVLQERTLGFIGTFILAIACVSLYAIGVFPETAGSIHFYVSVAFFTLFPVSLFFIGTLLIKEHSERNWGIFTISAGAFAAVSIATVIVLPMKGAAIPELLAALSASAWTIVFGVKLYKQSILH